MSKEKILNHKQLLSLLLSGKKLRHKGSNSILYLNGNWIEWNEEVTVTELDFLPSQKVI